MISEEVEMWRWSNMVVAGWPLCLLFEWVVVDGKLNHGIPSKLTSTKHIQNELSCSINKFMKKLN